MATENSGSPIIGRMKNRSRTRPTTAVPAIATSADRIQPSHVGPPMRLPGKFSATATYAVRYAPTDAIAPWAKFTTWVALKMMTKPSASRA